MDATNPTAEVTDPVDALMGALESEPFEDNEDQAPAETDAEEATDETTDEEVAPSDETPADEEEVDLDGEMVKVPKKIADAILRQKDYTQKTQAVAEEKRIVEDKRQFLEAREQLLGASFKDAAELQSLQSQLEQYAAVDWNTLIAEDPQQAMRLSMGRQDLQARIAEKQSSLGRTVEQMRATAAQHQAKQLEMGRAELQRRLGTLSADERKNTWQQGLALGFSEKELESIPDPRLMHAIYKAAKWDALQTAKPKAMQKVAEAPKAVRPVAPTPQKQRQNNEALTRLKKTGRGEELMKFL